MNRPRLVIPSNDTITIERNRYHALLQDVGGALGMLPRDTTVPEAILRRARELMGEITTLRGSRREPTTVDASQITH